MPSAIGIYNKVGSEQNPDGSYTSSPMKWAKFDSLQSSVRGYFEFINTNSYKDLKGETDPLTYLQKLKAVGYATSHEYVNNVYNTLTTNNLTQYDTINEGDDNVLNFKVHIDPGHYGSKYNKNTVGLDYYESAMTWKLSNYLKN